MSNASLLKKNIMRRIYFIYVLREIAKPLFLKLATVGLLSLMATGLVSVRQVFWNMPDIAEVTSLLKFSLSAFLNTEFAVQILIMGILACLAWMVRDIIRSLYAINTGRTLRALKV